MKKFIIAIIFLLFIILPITDHVFNPDAGLGNSISVAIRAGLTMIMIATIIGKASKTLPLLKVAEYRWCIFLIFDLFIISIFLAADSSVFYPLIRVLYPLLAFPFFYYLFKDDKLDDRLFSLFFISLIVVLTIITYLNSRERSTTIEGLETADNIGYALVCCYPAVMLFKNKKIFPIVILLVIVGTILAGKRGAIVALAASSIILVLNFLFSTSYSLRKKVFLLLLLSIALWFAYQYLGEYFMATQNRFEKIDEDAGHDRPYVYGLFLDGFNNSSFINQLFGNGLSSGRAFIGVDAHNDWLQLLYEFGMIGLFFYVMYMFSLIKTAVINIKKRGIYFDILAMTLIILLVKTTISSTFFIDINSIYLFALAGFSAARLNSKTTENEVVS